MKSLSQLWHTEYASCLAPFTEKVEKYAQQAHHQTITNVSHLAYKVMRVLKPGYTISTADTYVDDVPNTEVEWLAIANENTYMAIIDSVYTK